MSGTGGLVVVTLDLSPLFALRARVKTDSPKYVARAAQKAEGYAKAFSPVDTGMLRNSISAEQDAPLAWHIQDGPGVDGRLYGIYQEMGTYKMAAHPFFIPAIERIEHEFIELFMGLFK